MISIATLGPDGSDGCQAAHKYAPDATLRFYNRIPDIINAFINEETDLALIPIYNTREGEIKEYFRLMEQLEEGYWVDNIVLPIHLSLGILHQEDSTRQIKTIVGRGSVFRQCEDYIAENYPAATLMTVQDINTALTDIQSRNLLDHAVIESEELLRKHGLKILAREVVPHNRTRFAVLGSNLASQTGYDATAIITRPLKDRVGVLVDILGEFTRRGINILDLRSENDIKTQKLQIYIEAEGHIGDERLSRTLESIEKNIIQEEGSLKLLGSFPRVDMRVKKIKIFGFIGTGEMSSWFADRLENEGYRTLMTGRSTTLRPEEMIPDVDVVIICVPISVTADTIRRYGGLLHDGQALILLAGESENTLKTALEVTSQGVEIMLVHNLWGPQAATMKDKNASVVRTPRSGSFCSEFEAFLYKHGADIFEDTPDKHDLLMGVGQKLPTIISVAMAAALRQYGISCKDIGSHSTLTSLYGILAMARVHSQNPRTYAEIMATSGDGRKIVRSFAENMHHIIDLAEGGKITELCDLMDQNRAYLTPSFLDARMKQARAVDEVLTRVGMKGEV
ncbi:MAG: prephenate dehydrogenase/arogenate dehydrogenase family protein [Desulfoarculaceae bacterium]|nr:prephenate dehydrogenase/arogenate dehydrogenase family protein [Desulfoarculaceae bacterium]